MTPVPFVPFSFPELKILLGASRGAEDTWREAALGIPVDETNDPALLMYQAVLAHKSSLPTDKYLDRAAELYGELPSNVPLIRKLLAGKRFAGVRLENASRGSG